MSNDVIPHAAGEPARLMIKAWAEDHGMTLYQGREGTKFPARRWLKNAYPCWEYEPWSGTGPAIAQVHRYLAALDADDFQARELVASWNLPPHFATRGVSYTKGVITEHHYLRNFEGLKRILGMCPGLDFLANPDESEMWVKVYDTDYEVLSTQPDFRVPALPDSVISLHHQAAEERRQRSAADGEVPVERYLAEGIEHGQQSNELWRSACSLAGRRSQPAEILSILAEIVDHSQTDAWDPWRADQLASMADRAYRRYGKPPAGVRQLEMEDLADDPEFFADSDDEVAEADGDAAQPAAPVSGMSDCKVSFPGETPPEDDLEDSSFFIKRSEREFAKSLTSGFEDQLSENRQSSELPPAPAALESSPPPPEPPPEAPEPEKDPASEGANDSANNKPGPEPPPSPRQLAETRALIRLRQRCLEAMAPQLSLSMREDHARRLAASCIALIDRAIAIGSSTLDWSRQQAVAAFMALGAGQRTAYATLGELQEYGYVMLLGGLIKILGFPRPRCTRRTAAGERSATFAEALPFVRGAMRWLVREKNRVARWRIRQVANEELARSKELPGVEITMYQLGKCMAELQRLGEFTQVNPAVPVKEIGWDGSERWRSEPAERDPAAARPPRSSAAAAAPSGTRTWTSGAGDRHPAAAIRPAARGESSRLMPGTTPGKFAQQIMCGPPHGVLAQRAELVSYGPAELPLQLCGRTVAMVWRGIEQGRGPWRRLRGHAQRRPGDLVDREVL